MSILLPSKQEVKELTETATDAGLDKVAAKFPRLADLLAGKEVILMIGGVEIPIQIKASAD